MTLLNVEPRDVERKRRTRALRAAGYDVLEAASGEAALIATGRGAPSVALIEVQLPDTSGVELCDTLKRLRPGLVAVLISSRPTDSDGEEGSIGSADACFRAPIGGDALVALVEETVAREATRRDARPWVVTDEHGLILHASPGAARFLNRTIRGLQHTTLLVFFDQDRDTWRSALLRAAAGEHVRESGSVRPKERRPVRVSVDIARYPDWKGGSAVRWAFETLPGANGR